jgi:hypothetical protein
MKFQLYRPLYTGLFGRIAADRPDQFNQLIGPLSAFRVAAARFFRYNLYTGRQPKEPS